MDKRSITSAINGKKGGRKKGEATILREKAKDYLARRVEEEIEPIANKLIEKAQTGDVPAIKELFDRAWGKPAQAITGADGGILQVFIDKSLSHELTSAPATDSGK